MTTQNSTESGSQVNAPEDEVKSGLLLDVVVAQGAAILELLAGEDQTLLVWGNAIHAKYRTDQPLSSARLGSRFSKRTPPCPGSWP